MKQSNKQKTIILPEDIWSTMIRRLVTSEDPQFKSFGMLMYASTKKVGKHEETK